MVKDVMRALVASSKERAESRLTEAQARALAAWWGGRYERKVSPGAPAGGHGVILTAAARENGSARSPEITVFSLEEARALEKSREAVNPHSPDWAG